MRHLIAIHIQLAMYIPCTKCMSCIKYTVKCHQYIMTKASIEMNCIFCGKLPDTWMFLNTNAVYHGNEPDILMETLPTCSWEIALYDIGKSPAYHGYDQTRTSCSNSVVKTYGNVMFKNFYFPLMYRYSIFQGLEGSFYITPVHYFPCKSTMWRDQIRTSCWNFSVLLTPATLGSVCVACCGEAWRGDVATEDCAEFSIDVCTPHTPDHYVYSHESDTSSLCAHTYYEYIHICIYIYIYSIYIYVCVYIYTHTHMSDTTSLCAHTYHEYIHIYIYIYIYIYVCVYIHTHTHICMYVKEKKLTNDSCVVILTCQHFSSPIIYIHNHVYTYTYIYVCVYLYIHIHVYVCMLRKRSSPVIPSPSSSLFSISALPSYIYTNMYTHIHTYICVCIYTHTYMYIYVC